LLEWRLGHTVKPDQPDNSQKPRITPSNLNPAGPTAGEPELGSASRWPKGRAARGEDVPNAGRPPGEIPASEPEHQSRLGSVLSVETARLPSSRLIRFLRWWLPAIVCLSGVAIAIIDNFDATGLDALAALLGAGSSIWLMNFLWRLGVSGDDDREKEEAARVFLEVHGHWPDEPGPDR
jgi:hypothetical protein